MTFRILARQMKELGTQTTRRFVARMADYLRTSWAEVAAELGEGEALDAWVEAALAEGPRHGISTEPQAAQWILLLTRLGLDVAGRHPWAEPILTHRELAAEGKLVRLVVKGARHDPALVDRVVYPTYLKALERAEEVA